MMYVEMLKWIRMHSSPVQRRRLHVTRCPVVLQTIKEARAKRVNLFGSLFEFTRLWLWVAYVNMIACFSRTDYLDLF